jgi:hypothetical protein
MIYQIVSPVVATIEGDSFKEAIKNYVKFNHNLNIRNLIIKDQSNHAYEAKLRYDLETHKDYTKLSAELNYKFLYGYKKKGINVRGFAGYQFTDLEYNPYGFNLSDRSSTSGTKDYAYDNLYFGRTETEEFISRQIALRDGAFKAYTPFGSFKKNLFALNLDIDLPINFPLGFYIDLGTTDGLKEDIRSAYNLDVSVSYSAGISFKVISNLVAIYIPLINSKEINEYYSFSETSFGEKIRFTFNINELNPLRYKRTFLNQ